MSEPIIVRSKHLRALQLCAGGCREWFAAHDISWSEFVSNGVSSTVLEATGDTVWVPQVIEHARKDS